MKIYIDTDGIIIYIYVECEDIMICRETTNNKYTNLNKEIRKAKKFAKWWCYSKNRRLL